MADDIEEKIWWTRREAANHLRVTTHTVDDHVRAGRLVKYSAIGSRTVLLDPDQVRALVRPVPAEVGAE